MTGGGRPAQLQASIEQMADSNDKAILSALQKLGNPATRAQLKLTVETIASLAGVSRNTVRNRKWALSKLKELKKAAKNPPVIVDESMADEVKAPTVDELSKKLRFVLEQNALLYEEILYLSEVVAKRERDIELLSKNQLTIVKK